MGNILGVSGMYLFVPTGEPVTETRAHVHVCRMGGNKRVNMKFWLGPEVHLAKKHKSYSRQDVDLALELIRDNWERCNKEWARMYGMREAVR